MDWAWAYHAKQGMVKKYDIFPLFRDWRDINIRSVAFCIIIPIFLELCLVDYFMHTLFMQITYNLFDCNVMLPLHHQHRQHPRMDLHDLWVPSWNLRRQWQSVVLELIEILCDVHLIKWNESGFGPPLCTYRLNWARRTSWEWWADWDDTVLQTQDSKFEPWRS